MKALAVILIAGGLLFLILSCGNDVTGPSDIVPERDYYSMARIIAATQNPAYNCRPDSINVRQYAFALKRVDSLINASDFIGQFQVDTGGGIANIWEVEPEPPVDFHGIRLCFTFTRDSIPDEIDWYFSEMLWPFKPDTIGVVDWQDIYDTHCAFDVCFTDTINPLKMAMTFVVTYGFGSIPGFDHVEPLATRNIEMGGFIDYDQDVEFSKVDGSNIFITQDIKEDFIVLIQLAWGGRGLSGYMNREFFLFFVPVWEDCQFLGSFSVINGYDKLSTGEEYEWISEKCGPDIRRPYYEMTTAIRNLLYYLH